MKHPSPLTMSFFSTRFAAFALAAVLVIAPMAASHAGDALTTSSSTTRTRTSLLGSLLGIKSRSSSSSSSTSSTFSDRINRSILGLPIGLLKSATMLGNRAANSYVSKHIRSN